RPPWSPAHHEGPPPCGRPRLRATRRSHADARLRADARGCDVIVRQELAAGVAPMTNHHEEPAPLPALDWAVCSPSCWSQRWPYSRLSLVASGVTNAQPAAPSACLPSLLAQDARLHTTQIGGPLSGANHWRNTNRTALIETHNTQRVLTDYRCR